MNILTASLSQDVQTSAQVVATIVIEPDGDNSIIVVPRANMALTTADIDAAADCIADADVLLLQLETPIATFRTRKQQSPKDMTQQWS